MAPVSGCTRIGITTPPVTTIACAVPRSSGAIRSLSRAGRVVEQRPAQIAVSPSQYAERLSSWPQGSGCVGRPVATGTPLTTGPGESNSLTASTGGAHRRTPVPSEHAEIAIPSDSLVLLVGPAGS